VFSRDSAAIILVTAHRTEWTFGAEAAIRFSGPVVANKDLVLGKGLVERSARARIKDLQAEDPTRRNGLREPEPNPASDPLADSGMQERGHRVDQAVATRLEISDLAKRPIGRPHAARQAWAAVPAAAALRAPAVVLEVVVVVEAVVRVAGVVVEVAEEAGVPTSRSSMTSCYLAISPMALAITSLATTAAIARTLA
jgi:hypothetical protein